MEGINGSARRGFPGIGIGYAAREIKLNYLMCFYE